MFTILWLIWNHKNKVLHQGHLTDAGQYQLIIKLAEVRRTKPQRRAYAFVAKNM